MLSDLRASLGKILNPRRTNNPLIELFRPLHVLPVLRTGSDHFLVGTCGFVTQVFVLDSCEDRLRDGLRIPRVEQQTVLVRRDPFADRLDITCHREAAASYPFEQSVWRTVMEAGRGDDLGAAESVRHFGM